MLSVGCPGLIKDNILIPLHIPIWPMIKFMYNTVNVTAGELLLTFFVSLSVAPSGQFE